MSTWMQRWTLGLLVVAGVAAQGGSESTASLHARQTPEAQQAAAQTSEIRRLFDEDQKDREDMLRFSPSELEAVNQRDAQRRRRTRQLLEADAVQTGEDFRYAAFIFQHGDTPEDILLAHVLAVLALSKGDERSRGIAAATLDRYLHRVKQPQVFGTQYTAPHAATPEARQWTQEPYNRELVPPSLRRGMCVPNVEQQLEMLEGLKKGTPSPPPRVCP